ncbi:MAG: flavodoxin family protein [Coriobacteriales bacterium]|nr:flavodoxin family protein [Coriobacteriales bacterium]
MKIYALCASPRKRWNSDQMLDAFVEGVCEQAPEAEVEKFYLYDLDFKGCRSCFGCKLAKGDGSCVVRDSIHDLLIDIRKSDGFVYAAPIYFCDIPGQLRAFLERLMYPGPVGRELPVAAVYAMNANEHGWEAAIAPTIGVLHNYFQGNFGAQPREVIRAFDTMQRKPSDRYKPSKADHERKVARHDEVWPSELQRTREAGKRFAAHIQTPEKEGLDADL